MERVGKRCEEKAFGRRMGRARNKGGKRLSEGATHDVGEPPLYVDGRH